MNTVPARPVPIFGNYVRTVAARLEGSAALFTLSSSL